MYRLSFRQVALIALLSGSIAVVGAIALSRLLAGDGTATGLFPAVEPVAIADPTVATEEQNNIEIYRAVSPAVVNITTTAVIDTIFGAYPQKGSGSGSIIDVGGDRYVLTNFHVIREGASRRQSRIEVTLADKSSYPASVVGIDPDHDIALLRIEAPAAKLVNVVQLGSSAGLQVGQKVLAIGNPFGLDRTLTTGVISALERPLQSPSGRQIAGVIQTDASINPGNSGGPLLNSRGEVIGINTAIFSESGGSVGIGFAVPIDIVKQVLPELISSGRVARSYLGIGFRPLDTRINRMLGFAQGSTGLLVVNIEPGSPAARAGLRPVERTPEGYAPGDVIISIDGTATKAESDLSLILNQKRPGETVRLSVMRAGRPFNVDVRLAEAPQGATER